MMYYYARKLQKCSRSNQGSTQQSTSSVISISTTPISAANACNKTNALSLNGSIPSKSKEAAAALASLSLISPSAINGQNGQSSSSCSSSSSTSNTSKSTGVLTNEAIKPFIPNFNGVQQQPGKQMPGASCCKNSEHELEKGLGLVFSEQSGSRTLISGTLEDLILNLVPTPEYFPDRPFLFSFLLVSRLYMPTYELLWKIFNLAIDIQEQQMQQSSPNYQNFIEFLNQWSSLIPYDFRDERMMQKVRMITQKLVNNDVAHNEISQVLSKLLNRMTALESYEDLIHRMNERGATQDPNTAPSLSSICTSTVLAQQLTHVELFRLSNIGPEEFIQASARENLLEESPENKDLPKRTRNVEYYIQWFNRLSYIVATDICKNTNKKKLRRKAIMYWISTALECFGIGNFNSLMAILSGLNLSPIARLKKSWKKVSMNQLKGLEEKMNPSNNFSTYRLLLKEALLKQQTSKTTFVIPVFSILIKDLHFLADACLINLPNGHINFEKVWLTAKEISEIIALKQIQTCCLPKVPEIMNLIQSYPVLDKECDLWEISFKCEAGEKSGAASRAMQQEGKGKSSSSLFVQEPNQSQNTGPPAVEEEDEEEEEEEEEEKETNKTLEI